MSRRKVYVSEPWAGGAEELFGSYARSKYQLVKTPEECEMIVFNGGEDINPELYGEEPISNVWFNKRRDAQELAELRRVPTGAFKFGICRGGQLLNVLAGGSLVQHTDNHGRAHPITCHLTGASLITSSVHHQQFRPTAEALLVASARISKIRVGSTGIAERVTDDDDPDPEIVWYGAVGDHAATSLNASRSLCIQGHPEYGGYNEFTDYCLALVDRFWKEAV